MSKSKSERPQIPPNVQKHLWLRAGGRCEFRGCNEILYEDKVTQDPINEANIAHIISWTETGPRGDKILSPKLATDIGNLMLLCQNHHHMVDLKKNVKKYSISVLQDMKQEHERAIRLLIDLRKTQPIRVIELMSMIQEQRPSITEEEEANALYPRYPKAERIVIDVCDIDDLETARKIIREKVTKRINDRGENERYAAFIMATIPLGCYFGYVIGNKTPVDTFQHFRTPENWIWRESDSDYSLQIPETNRPVSDVNLLINVSGEIDVNLIPNDYPIYQIMADNPCFDFLQSYTQVESFRKEYRNMLDQIRNDHGECVNIHLFPATPNPINFEIGKGIMKNVDPTIILYDKACDTMAYRRVMTLHERIRM